MNKLYLAFLISLVFYQIKPETRGCCPKTCSTEYKNLIVNNLEVNNSELIKKNLTVLGTIDTSIINTKNILVNQKEPVLGLVESINDLRFTLAMPTTIDLKLTASSSSPYVITASITSSTITRMRGFGTKAISNLSVITPAVNLSTSGFSLVYGPADGGSVTNLTTASAIVVNLYFDVKFSINFSSISSFALPTVNLSFENLGSFVNSATPGAFISNFNYYITNLTNSGFTVNMAITAIGEEITSTANVNAIATLISDFIKNSYIDFIIQGS